MFIEINNKSLMTFKSERKGLLLSVNDPPTPHSKNQ